MTRTFLVYLALAFLIATATLVVVEQATAIPTPVMPGDGGGCRGQVGQWTVMNGWYYQCNWWTWEQYVSNSPVWAPVFPA